MLLLYFLGNYKLTFLGIYILNRRNCVVLNLIAFQFEKIPFQTLFQPRGQSMVLDIGLQTFPLKCKIFARYDFNFYVIFMKVILRYHILKKSYRTLNFSINMGSLLFQSVPEIITKEVTTLSNLVVISLVDVKMTSNDAIWLCDLMVV